MLGLKITMQFLWFGNQSLSTPVGFRQANLPRMNVRHSGNERPEFIITSWFLKAQHQTPSFLSNWLKVLSCILVKLFTQSLWWMAPMGTRSAATEIAWTDGAQPWKRCTEIQIKTSLSKTDNNSISSQWKLFLVAPIILCLSDNMHSLSSGSLTIFFMEKN